MSQDTKTIFINYEEEANETLCLLKERGFTRSGMRKASQYCITVYENEFNKLYGIGAIQPISEDIEDFYELRDEEKYTEKIGLELELDDGAAVFF